MVLAALVCGAGPGIRRALADTSWQGPAGVEADWHDPANWGNGVPDGDDRVAINNSGIAVVSHTGETGFFFVGMNHSGGLVQTGGTLYVRDRMLVASDPGSSGFCRIDGGTLLLPEGPDSWLFVGSYGVGHFQQNGGSVQSQYLALGVSAGGHGTYVLASGELLTSSAAYIGQVSTGLFVNSGGLHEAKSVYVGSHSGGDGTYELSATGQLAAGRLSLGWGGTGVFSQVGGTLDAGYVKVEPAGSYTLTGGTATINTGLLLEGTLDFATPGGTLILEGISDFTGGSMLNTTNASITCGPKSLTIFPFGFDPQTQLGSYSSEGLTHVPGSTLVVPAGTGFGGRGDIYDHVETYADITAAEYAAINLCSGVNIADGATVLLEEGEVFVEDLVSGISGGQLVTSKLNVGTTDTGSFAQTGGEVWLRDPEDSNQRGSLQIGGVAGTDGSYLLDGGILHGGNITIGDKGTGRFAQTGGELQTYVMVIESVVGTALYQMSAGHLSARELRVGDNSTFDFTGGRLELGQQFTGHLLNKGGVLAPGASAGMITITKTYQQQAGATLEIDIGGMPQGTDYDTLAIGGNLTLAGELAVVNLGGVPETVTSYTILTAGGGVSGTFDTVSDGHLGLFVDDVVYNPDCVIIEAYQARPGDTDGNLVVNVLDLSALAANWSALSPGDKCWTEGDSNGDMVVDILDLTGLAANWTFPAGSAGPVPEPTALVLLGLGGLVLIRRRRK